MGAARCRVVGASEAPRRWEPTQCRSTAGQEARRGPLEGLSVQLPPVPALGSPTARRSPHLTAHLQPGPPASSQPPPAPRPTAGRLALLEAPTACHHRCLRPLTCRAPLHLPVLPQLSAMPFLGHPELHSASSLDFFDSLPQVGASAGRGLAAAAAAGADAARAGSCTLRCTCPSARRAHAPYLWRPAAVHGLLQLPACQWLLAAAAQHGKCTAWLVCNTLRARPMRRLPAGMELDSLDCSRMPLNRLIAAGGRRLRLCACCRRPTHTSSWHACSASPAHIPALPLPCAAGGWPRLRRRLPAAAVLL